MSKSITEAMGRRTPGAKKIFAGIAIVCLALTPVSCATQQAAGTRPPLENFQAACRPEIMQAVAARVLSTRVTVQQVANGPNLPGGVQFVGATADLPAYCRVSGSYVTNPATGKTANFLATLPANWNGKYLQIGCGGTCGMFAVNDASTAVVTISTQGRPGDIVRRGYASFGTDEGHGMEPNWALNAQGQVNQDAVDDFYYRATQVLSHMGKEFTRGFFAQVSGRRAYISYSYFAGCSDGGRDALVAASYFPEQFDGIIAGSPANSFMGLSYQGAGIALAQARSADAIVSPALMSRVGPIVTAQCDRLDGVQDGLVQNPAACNFRPERDLPRCAGDAIGGQCFSQAQIETISTVITGVTDEHGAVLYGGFSITELQTGASTDAAPNPWSLFTGVLVHGANSGFQSGAAVRGGGPGSITGFRTIVPRAEFDFATQIGRMGIGSFPENADRMLGANKKLLLWLNLSDQSLAPFETLNYYNQLAARHDGFSNLQRNARLFAIPGSTHCSINGIGPNSFDALGAMEGWVERGQPPNALTATLYAPQPGPMATRIPSYHYDQPPIRTMPLCMYPQMARYNGNGDVNAAGNWSCSADDTRMLTLGESGRRAGAFVHERE